MVMSDLAQMLFTILMLMDTSNADGHTFYLGESKCYESKYQFATAFEASLASIVNTVNTLNKELDLYVYDDFIEPELESIAKQYKANTLKSPRIELVCIIAYNETTRISGGNEDEIKASIKSIIEAKCNSLKADVFHSVDVRLLDRINYIVFPIWSLDTLLDDFQKYVGS